MNDTIYVHFLNTICPYSFCICTAKPGYRCLPIQALDLLDYTNQVQKRANYCSYIGLKLTEKQVETRDLPQDKADKCKYLLR
jgi:hypothetical protein